MALGSTIKGITIEFNGDTTKLGKAMREVDDKAKGVDKSLKQVNTALKFNPKNTELLGQKMTLLGSKIKQTEDKLKLLKQTQSKLDDDPSVDKNSQEYMELRREIIETESRLKHFKAEQEKLNNIKFEQLGKSLKSVGDKMSTVGSSMTRNVTTPIMGIVGAAVKVGTEFDAQMSKVQAISGATGKDFKDLRDKAREMGAKTKYSATEAGQGFEYMAMAGWKTKDMLKGIKPILDLAAASGGDLGRTSDIVTDALTAFGLEAKDAGHFSDILAKASSNANTNVELMGETFKYVAPVAGTLKYRAEDVATGIGLMANSGIKASQAGTALRAGLLRLAAPSKQTKEAMAELGVDIKDANGNILPFNKLLEQLRGKFKGLSKAEQVAMANDMFGKNAASGWLAMINSSDKDLNKLTKSIENCDGASKEMADVMMKNNKGAFEILKSALSEAAIQINDRMKPAVEALIKFFNKLVDKFNALPKGVQDFILKAALFAAAIGPILLVGGKILSTVGSFITIIPKLLGGVAKVIGWITKIPALLSLIGGAASKLIGVIMANPIIAIIAAIIAIVILLWKNWDKVKAYLVQIWNTISSAAKAIWEPIKKFFVGIWNGIKGAAITVWNGIKTFFSTIWNGIKAVATVIWNGIKAYFVGWFNIIKTVATTVWKAIKTFLSTTWNGIKKAASTIWNGIKKAVLTPINALKSALSKAWSGIKSKASSVWNSIKSTASSVWNGVKKAITSPITAAKNAVKKIVSKIKGFFNFDFKLPKIKLPHFSIDPPGWSIGDLLDGEIPSLGIDWYAKGGIFKRPSVIGVGEAGAEAVLPIDRLETMLASMADSIVNGVATAMALQTSGADGEQTINITNYLYPNGAKMGEETVKIYDKYKKILG